MDEFKKALLDQMRVQGDTARNSALYGACFWRDVDRPNTVNVLYI